MIQNKIKDLLQKNTKLTFEAQIKRLEEEKNEPLRRQRHADPDDIEHWLEDFMEEDEIRRVTFEPGELAKIVAESTFKISQSIISPLTI